jgi:CheY-like chemotaxis protein
MAGAVVEREHGVICVNAYHYLYVEDDALSREIMQMILEHGMGVTNLVMFENSANFYQRVTSLPHPPNVVLLDIHVQPIDGFEMLQMLRSDPAFESAKIVALTASVMNDEIDRLRNSGFDGAIAKPLSILTFPTLMERIISGEVVWHTG